MSNKFQSNAPVRPSPELLEALKQWKFPQVEDERPKAKKTNALGRENVQNPVIEELEDEVPALPTLEEVEAIRQEAYQDGFNEGREAGYAEGLEQGSEEGRKTGHEEGVSQGHSEGFAQGEEAVNKLQAQWLQLVQMLDGPMQAVDDSAEKQLVSMVVALAEAVVGKEITQQPESILNAVQSGVKLLAHDKQPIEILLHPDDLMIIKAHYNDEMLEEQQWRLVMEPTLEAGGCIVRNPGSVVDLTLKNRLSSVMDSFLQSAGIESED